jgi:hypothetical protein
MKTTWGLDGGSSKLASVSGVGLFFREERRLNCPDSLVLEVGENTGSLCDETMFSGPTRFNAGA